MYSVSDAWDLEIRSGGRRITVVDLYDDPTSGVATLTDIPIESFSVTADRRSTIRRSGSITIIDQDLIDALKDNSSSLEPYGVELHIKSGVVYADDSTELVPLGVFQIEDLEWNESDTAATCNLFDRSKLLERALFGIPFFTDGESVQSVIIGLMDALAPWVTVVIDPSLPDFNTIPSNVYPNDHLSAIQAMATSLGGEMYFDVAGVMQIVPIPVIPTDMVPGQADWKVDTGDQGVMIAGNRSISRTDVCNEVWVFGNPPNDTDEQPYAVVKDDDPSSPTYYYGPFGKADKVINQQEFTTYDQCYTLAVATLNDSRGLSKTLKLSSLSNPALAEGDIVAAYFLDGSVELHLVDKLEVNQTCREELETRVQVIVA